MSKNKQRTGIFDLNDVTESIKLNGIEKERKEEFNSVIVTPRILVEPTELKSANGNILIDKALLIVKEQMRLSGIRAVTIREYIYTFNRLVNDMELRYLNEITLEVVFEWLSSLGDVTNVTKQSRLRVIKAVLNRFYDNGWYEKKWWKDIKVKVDNKIKPPADEQQLSILLSLLDMTNFIQFRDAVAILTVYKCGLRMSTLIKLQEKHIDFENNLLLLSGDIMKNHDILKLPINDELANWFKRLIQQNKIIRKHYKKSNSYVFVSKFGDPLVNDKTPNAITKRMSYYAKKYGLTNINPHAIRRLFAQNLLKNKANIALISKALGHKSLATTTYYLGANADEVADNLRDYL